MTIKTNPNHPFFQVEEVSSTEVLVHTKKLGSFYVVMDFDNELSEESKQANIYNQGFHKEIYWIPEGNEMKLFLMGNWSSKTLDEAVEDVMELYYSGYLIDLVYGTCEHAVEEWMNVPEIIEATYQALKTVIEQAG